MFRFGLLRTSLRLCGLTLALGFAPLLATAQPPPYETVTIETVTTSIYIGQVTLYTDPLQRSGEVYSASYHARVFPYFFSNEKGQLWITFNNADLARLAKGETVYFKGRAENTDHEPRRIEGRAIPADATHGKIKVRVFVTPTLQLIFNTLYHFD